jgi:hypothetical protein
MNFRPITTAINGLALPLRKMAHDLELLLDVAASIDRHLEEIERASKAGQRP